MKNHYIIRLGNGLPVYEGELKEGFQRFDRKREGADSIVTS